MSVNLTAFSGFVRVKLHDTLDCDAINVNCVQIELEFGLIQVCCKHRRVTPHAILITFTPTGGQPMDVILDHEFTRHYKTFIFKTAAEYADSS